MRKLGSAILWASSLVLAFAPRACQGAIATKAVQVANNTTSVAVDASPGTLLTLRVMNNSNVIAWAKFYDAAQGSTTCGSGTPVLREMIPAATAGGSGVVIQIGAGKGRAFATAITLCVVLGIADTDTTAPAANTYLVSGDYK